MQTSRAPIRFTPDPQSAGQTPEQRAALELDNSYCRTISEVGVPENAIWAAVKRLIDSNRCQVTSGQAFARPVTATHPLAAAIVMELSQRLKPNLPLTFAYEGVWDLIDAAGDAILDLARHPDPRNGGMVVLKSATQSLSQALHLFRSQYYARYGVNLAEVGLAGAALSGAPRPAVLAAINNNIMLSKAASLVGFGKQDLFLYSLDEKFQADEESLREALNRAHLGNRRVVAHLTIAGDAEHGIAHNVRRLDQIASAVCADYGYRPPVIVDAAAQWLNLLMTNQSENWDLRAENDNIKAVIFDPQKTELPFDLSLLLLRDFQDLDVLIDRNHYPTRDKRLLQAQANNILSRGGEPIVAAYFYLMNQGLSGLRESRARIMGCTREIADYIRQDPRYVLVSEPQGSVVTWRVKDDHPLANWAFVQHMNAQRDDRLLLTYNAQCRARTASELESSLRGDRAFDGVVAHCMEHNTASAVQLLIQRMRDYRSA